MPFFGQSRGRGLSNIRPRVLKTGDKMGLPWNAYYVLTKALASLPNSKVHPNTGAPNYNIQHLHSALEDADWSAEDSHDPRYYTEAEIDAELAGYMTLGTAQDVTATKTWKADQDFDDAYDLKKVAEVEIFAGGLGSDQYVTLRGPRNAAGRNQTWTLNRHSNSVDEDINITLGTGLTCAGFINCGGGFKTVEGNAADTICNERFCYLLGFVGPIDATATGTTELYDIETAKFCSISFIQFFCQAFTGGYNSPEVSVGGTGAGYIDFMPATVLGMTGSGKGVNFMPDNNTEFSFYSDVLGNDPIYINVHTASTSTTYDLFAAVFGFIV